MAFLYLDAIALRVRMDRRVTSVPVLVALAVLADAKILAFVEALADFAFELFIDGKLPAELLVDDDDCS